jgi:hypothetical protein
LGFPLHHDVARPSPFADRLNTNYIPSDSEIVEIRALLIYPPDELAQVESRIEEMEVALSKLKELRASLKCSFSPSPTVLGYPV